jgi:hypothetical protein
MKYVLLASMALLIFSGASSNNSTFIKVKEHSKGEEMYINTTQIVTFNAAKEVDERAGSAGKNTGAIGTGIKLTTGSFFVIEGTPDDLRKLLP